MLKQAKGVFQLNLDDLALYGGVLGGGFLLVHIITALAVKFSGEGTSLMLSGILLPIAGGILIAIMAAGHVLMTFDHAVRFGQTRRRALALTAGQILLESGFAVAVAAALNALERRFAPALWLKLSGMQVIHWGVDGRRIPEGREEEYFQLWGDILFIEDFALDWWVLPLLVLGGAALGFVGGAVIQRFGKQGGWFIWGVCMTFCFVFPRLPWRTHEVVDVLIPVLVAAAIAAFFWSIWSLLRAVVKG